MPAPIGTPLRPGSMDDFVKGDELLGFQHASLAFVRNPRFCVGEPTAEEPFAALPLIADRLG